MRYQRKQSVNKKLSLFSSQPGTRSIFSAGGATTPRGLTLVLLAGCVLPMTLIGAVKPVAWIIALQLACGAGLMFLRWRTPGVGGSPLVFGVALIACLITVAAAIAT